MEHRLSCQEQLTLSTRETSGTVDFEQLEFSRSHWFLPVKGTRNEEEERGTEDLKLELKSRNETTRRYLGYFHCRVLVKPPYLIGNSPWKNFKGLSINLQ